MVSVSPNKGFSWLALGSEALDFASACNTFSVMRCQPKSCSLASAAEPGTGLTLTPSLGQGIFFSRNKVVCALQLCFRRCLCVWGAEGSLGQRLSTQQHVTVPPGEVVCVWRLLAYKWMWGLWRMDWSSFQDRMRTIIRVTETSSHWEKRWELPTDGWEGQRRRGEWERGADSKEGVSRCHRTDIWLSDWEQEGGGECIYEDRHDNENEKSNNG